MYLGLTACKCVVIVVSLFCGGPSNNGLPYEIFLDDMKQVSHTMLLLFCELKPTLPLL